MTHLVGRKENLRIESVTPVATSLDPTTCAKQTPRAKRVDPYRSADVRGGGGGGHGECGDETRTGTVRSRNDRDVALQKCRIRLRKVSISHLPHSDD